MARVKQAVLVKKSAAPTKSSAKKLAKRHADKLYTVRTTVNFWRFRQRPPACFVGRMRTFRVPPTGNVLIVYGTLKKGAEKRKACR